MLARGLIPVMGVNDVSQKWESKMGENETRSIVFAHHIVQHPVSFRGKKKQKKIEPIRRDVVVRRDPGVSGGGCSSRLTSPPHTELEDGVGGGIDSTD